METSFSNPGILIPMEITEIAIRFMFTITSFLLINSYLPYNHAFLPPVFEAENEKPSYRFLFP